MFHSSKRCAIGAPILWLGFHVAYVDKRFERYSFSESSRIMLTAADTILFGGLCWFVLGVAPYSFVPSIVYPCYTWAKYGDHVTDL